MQVKFMLPNSFILIFEIYFLKLYLIWVTLFCFQSKITMRNKKNIIFPNFSITKYLATCYTCWSYRSLSFNSILSRNVQRSAFVSNPKQNIFQSFSNDFEQNVFLFKRNQKQYLIKLFEQFFLLGNPFNVYWLFYWSID
jgi:hypothetical protein